MVDILVPRARLKTPIKQVFPSRGELRMRCQNCNGMSFVVHVRPYGKDMNAARVTELVCEGCKRVFHLDGQANLESDGKVEVKGES